MSVNSLDLSGVSPFSRGTQVTFNLGLNVLIGPHMSGKTAVLDVLKNNHGAISLQGQTPTALCLFILNQVENDYLDTWRPKFFQAVKEIMPSLKKISYRYSSFDLELEDSTLSLYDLSPGIQAFLCQAANLLSLRPGRLLVYEMPEQGIHPDMLPTIRDLLLEAAKECQIVITTYSPFFLGCLTAYPEVVLVCGNGEISPLPSNLPDQGLDQIWMSGLVGGVRY